MILQHFESPDWEEAFINVREILDIPPDAQMPELPRGTATHQSGSHESLPPGPPSSAKRKTEDNDVEMDSGTEESKRARITSNVTVELASPSNVDTARIHAQAAAAYIPFLDIEHLLPPKLPTHDEMEGVLLALRKKALVEEYFGDAT